MRDFLKLLLAVGEKGANISRIIRSNESLFKLLIEEKLDDEKNVRFLQDFKTLADVLIQECLRYEIAKKYPEMKDSIFGEESNTFTNCEGDSITIKIGESVVETTKLLTKVMAIGESGFGPVKILAQEIHKEVYGGRLDLDLEKVPSDNLDWKNVGIWIDPIDGTNEYIKGSKEDLATIGENEVCDEPIFKGGLHCVTVLIGAFHLNTGEPILGIVNQPFYKLTRDNREETTPIWEGRHFWGLRVKGHTMNNIPSTKVPRRKKLAILSSSEDPELLSKLGSEFDLQFAPGAGYKLLTVILGQADVYVLSKNTTHFWDTCGPHAILKSLKSGGILRFDEVYGNCDNIDDISYVVSEDLRSKHFPNEGGIIAYRDNEILTLLRKCFHSG